MEYPLIEDHVLETFVSGKYHWQSLSPQKQKAMAVELLKHRFMHELMLQFMGELIADNEAWKKYRELLTLEMDNDRFTD